MTTRGGRLSKKLIVILASLTAFAPLSIDMYLPSFPTLEIDLKATSTAVQFSLAAFFIGLALGQALYGPLADRYGRKRPLYLGLSLYIVASAGCAFAPTIEALIGLRFLQALGGCAGIVIARAMVRDLFDHRDSARVFSLLTLVLGVAPILAPLAGGYIVTYLGWRVIFWFLSAFGVACLIAAITALPETLPVTARTSPRHSNPVLGALKVYRQLAADPRYIGYALAGSMAQAGLFAYISNSPFIFIKLYGVSEENYGWFFGTNALGLIASSQVNHRLLARWTPDQILSRVILLIAIFGSWLLFMAITGLGGFWGLLPPLFGYVACLGFSFPDAVAGAMSNQSGRAGSASALLGTIQFSLATLAGGIVGLVHAHSAIPMAAVMATCGLTALFLHRRLVKPLSLRTDTKDGSEIDLQVAE